MLRPFAPPQLKGKVERVNRTLLVEWAYVRPHTRNGDRIRFPFSWLHHYDYHRARAALGGLAPVTPVNNPRGKYI